MRRDQSVCEPCRRIGSRWRPNKKGRTFALPFFEYGWTLCNGVTSGKMLVESDDGFNALVEMI